MAAYYKAHGKTLVDVLEDMFKEFGYYVNKTVTFAFEGASGLEKMAGIMEKLRNHPLIEVAGASVIETSDYKLSITKNAQGETPITLPKSNVLGYKLSDGCSFLVRPSGTEPKLKIYMFGKAQDQLSAQKRVEELCNALSEIVK
jgi:phosphoglucomutase